MHGATHVTPQIIYIKTKIGPAEIKHFQIAKCKIFIGKADMQPRPLKSKHIDLKRAWN